MLQQSRTLFPEPLPYDCEDISEKLVGARVARYFGTRWAKRTEDVPVGHLDGRRLAITSPHSSHTPNSGSRGGRPQKLIP
jgi:hypothetical protein